MIKNTVHIPQKIAEGYVPKLNENIAIISITGTRNEDADLNPGFKKILRLKFDDIDQEVLSDKTKYLKYYGITDSQAKEIINFVEELIKDEVRWSVIVHCHAGISRSAAVCKYISEIADLSFPNDYTIYNHFVFGKLMKMALHNLENI